MNAKRVLLCGVYPPEEKHAFLAKEKETEALCRACHREVIASFHQASRHPDPHTVFRSGRLEEVKAACTELAIDEIVFLQEIPHGAANRIGAYCGVKVIDRTALILTIFAQNARTKEARIQTEMAWLLYTSAHTGRIQDEKGHASGAFYSRGSGESAVALKKRESRRRYAALKEQLDLMQNQKGQDERRRAKTLLKKAAIVGYTNAGKSSFMNALIAQGSQGHLTRSEDALFVTLDTTVRKIAWHHYAFYLYDTVGFVSDLPEELLDAFETTLQAARAADVLLHIIDISDPAWKDKEEAVTETLQRIGADGIPVIRLFSKADLPHEAVSEEGILISVKDGTGMEKAGQKIAEALYGGSERKQVLLPYDKMDLAAAYQEVLDIQPVVDTEEGRLLEMRGQKQYLEVFAAYEYGKEVSRK